MITSHPTYSETRHIPSLDGLRGLAIILVIAFHYYQLPLGWSGVDLFFVLSGYLITGRLLDSLDKPDYFRRFYRNRILRIFPLYYAVLIVFFAGFFFFAKNETQPLLHIYYTHWKSFFLFTENFTFIIYGMPVTAYLLHFWSLAVEEQFYLVWPSVICLLKDPNTRLKWFTAIPLLVLIIRSLFVYCQSHPDSLTFYYYNTFFRIDTLVIGALLCQLHQSKINIPVRLVNILILVSLTLLGLNYCVYRNWDSSNTFFRTIGYTLIAILCACLLHKAVQSSGSLLQHFFSLPGLRFLGKISYGLYIFHLPVWAIFQERIFNWGQTHIVQGEAAMRLLSISLCLPITFIISFISFRYFESFFLRLKKR
jgi:peptidoglycan/LPS O-acetylase OafA/YrhL